MSVRAKLLSRAWRDPFASKVYQLIKRQDDRLAANDALFKELLDRLESTPTHQQAYEHGAAIGMIKEYIGNK